jgi:hypothetical protein
MTTLSPQITAAGISGPSYADIFAQLQSQYWQIYGSDAVLTPDTQDGQMLAVFAQAIYDAGQACIATYQQFSPQTAQGTGLSSVVKINGLTRIGGTPSTAVVTITGTAGTVINGGMIGDNQNLNTQWTLPATVTIPLAGTIAVTATCTVNGATAAAPATLVNILTPTAGWTGVTNAGAATAGVAVETDIALRVRQGTAAAQPSQTLLAGIKTAVAAVSGASPSWVYENDTDTVNSIGLQPHSIGVVTAGGAPASIAAAIATKKSPGTSTNGPNSYTYVDPNGVPDLINWYTLANVPLTLTVTVHSINNYVSTTSTLIQQSVSAWVNSLGIGGTSYLNQLFAPAMLFGDGAVAATGYSQAQLEAFSSTYTITSILQSRTGPPAAADVAIAFNELSTCAPASVTVVVA